MIIFVHLDGHDFWRVLLVWCWLYGWQIWCVGIWVFPSSFSRIFYVKLWLKHQKGKWRAGSSRLTQITEIYLCVGRGGGVLVNKCLYIWWNLVLRLVIHTTWLWGLGESSWPSFASKFLLWLPLCSKKNLTVMYHQFDHVDSLTETAWGMMPIGHFTRSAKVPKLVWPRSPISFGAKRCFFWSYLV